MKKSSLLFISIFIYHCHATITQKYRSVCALLSHGTRIYCYSGGYQAAGDSQVNAAETDFYYLDLATGQPLIADEIVSKWSPVLPENPTDFMLEPLISATGVAISDTMFVVDGGYFLRGNSINKTTLYDTESSKWSSISNVNRNLTTKVYGGTAVYVPNLNTVVYWGGLSGKYPGVLVNITTVLHINQGFQWTVCPGELPAGTFTRYGHTATLLRNQVDIMYVGGRLRDNSDTSVSIPYKIVPMSDILIYNTKSAVWTLNTTNAENISQRYLHTATLLPNSDDILIYGGATDNGDEAAPKHVSDYLYILDSKTLTYRTVNEQNTNFKAGPRFGHSAILCNTTLFILFGFNEKEMLTSDTFFFSVASGSQFSWLQSFPLANTSNQDNLSVGAIVGIAVGVFVFFIGLIILSSFMFIKWRKKRDRMTEIQNEKKRQRQSWVGSYNPNEYVEPTFTPISDMLSSSSSSDGATVKNENVLASPTTMMMIDRHKPNQMLYQPMISRDHQYNRSSSFLDLPPPKLIKPSL